MEFGEYIIYIVTWDTDHPVTKLRITNHDVLQSGTLLLKNSYNKVELGIPNGDWRQYNIGEAEEIIVR